MIEHLADFGSAMWSLRWLWCCVLLVIAGLCVFADDGRHRDDV